MAASHMGHPKAVNRLLLGGANANQQAKVSNLLVVSYVQVFVYFSTAFL